jgi:hypothetical protein
VPVQLGANATLFDATAVAMANETYLHTLPAYIVTKPVPPGYLAHDDIHYEVIGHHYFDAASTPIFNLSVVNQAGFMSKQVGVNAPAGSSVGPDDTSAVAWLFLINKPGYVQKGVTQVYRVETAGGNPYPNCTSATLMQIQYAAEYWFYD